MIISGAIAMIGSVWDATSSGVRARRSHGEKSTAIAIAQPTASDTANPTAVTCRVGTVWAQIWSRYAQPCSSTRSGDGSTCGGTSATVTYHCHTTSPTATSTAGGASRAASRAPPPGARSAAEVSGGRSDVVIAEPGGEVGPLGERRAVGPGEHARVEHPARVALPLLERLGADAAVLVAQEALGEHALAAQHELGLGERAGVGVHQQLGGAIGLIGGELVAALRRLHEPRREVRVLAQPRRVADEQHVVGVGEPVVGVGERLERLPAQFRLDALPGDERL